MGRRIAECSLAPELRRKLGEAGRTRILRLAGADQECRALAEVIEWVQHGAESAELSRRKTALLTFIRDNPRAQPYPVCDSPFDHPLDFGAASLYGVYRDLRTSAGKWYQRGKEFAAKHIT
jgi:hypothetical protein